MRDRPYFMDIGLYRTPKERFNQTYVEAREREFAKLEGCSPDLRQRLMYASEFHLANHYGWPWEFNQTVAWLRLFVRDGVVYGDWWLYKAKRFTRTMRKKRLEHVDKTALYYAPPAATSADIAAGIRRGLLEAQSKVFGGRGVLDLNCFDALSPHIDWRAVVYPNGTNKIDG